MSREPQKILTFNPANGAALETYEPHSPAQLDEKLRRAVDTQNSWRALPPIKRAPVLMRVHEILLREKASLAALMEAEMGKKLADGVAEIEKCAAGARYYAEKGPAFLAEMDIPTEAKRSFVAFEPLGTLLAVMPWNFPFWQVFRCALPATLAGNTVLLKHASNVSGSALAAEKIWREAYGREGLFQTLLLPGASVLPLLARAEISAVSFTGSTSVGKEIAAAAGANLKKCVLELGGSDPYLVLADADLDLAAALCAKSRMLNSGQSCIAAKRFIVEAPVRERFEEKFLRALQSVELAPLAREDLRADLHAQVQRSVALGATLKAGGKIPPGPGWFYPATLLTNVSPGMPAFDEELFGPVAAVIEAKDEEDAIRLANQSVFGLGAAVFTRDAAKGALIATKRLEAGSCFVNDFVRSDARLPFGGIKESGYGRELSDFGLREFVNVKTVFVGR